MVLAHNSRLADFRNPGGACQAGEAVWLALQVEPQSQAVLAVRLCYAYGLYHFQESYLTLTREAAASLEQPGGASCPAAPEPDGEQVYAGRLRLPAKPGLFFYWFELDTPSGRIFFTADPESAAGGGRLSGKRPGFLPGETAAGRPWQITVYAADFQVPAWLPGTVFYQLFPDRFNRDSRFTIDRFQAVAFPERIFHPNWREEVDYKGLPATGYIACDFFGGSLAGIREKLDHLASFGVGALYLNPIFRARSNHRYDTGDYEQVDPLLGSEADFKDLCAEAAARGIRIVLDGVFNHSGADSRYFNKYGRYPGTGAWQEANGQGRSPYASWYEIARRDGQLAYDSWWGFADLPNIREHDLSYRDYVAGPDGIVRRWLRLGAAGWRLDVSDELPDDFLRDIRQAAKAEKPDAMILGEVWEEASAKISYGAYRDFLFGQTHDTVMGYPFRLALLGWLGGCFPAQAMRRQLEQLQENAPPPCFYSSFNLIGSHDTPRVLTVLSGAPEPQGREEAARLCLSPDDKKRSQTLLRLAVLFQMAYPGCPVIYYGDEAGMEGSGDPFNRRTYPWGGEDPALLAWFRQLGGLRRENPVLRTGCCRWLYAEGDCLALERTLPAGYDAFGQAQQGPRRALTLLNRSPQEQTIEADGRQFTMPGYGGLLSLDNEKAAAT